MAACLLAAAGCGGEDAGAPPHSETYTLNSKVLDVDLDQVIVREGRGRPLLVLLHGKDGQPGDFYGKTLDSTLRALGAEAPNVLMPAGGASSYWHNRRDGEWGRYLLHEAIPEAIAKTGADAKRIAIGGFSMGGFGALALALAHPGYFCAAGGHAPALWKAARATAPGAFDDPADFKRHDLLAAAKDGWPFGSTRIWLDVDTHDPFRATTTELARELGSRARFTVWPGTHSTSYIRRHLPQTLRWYAAALAACKSGRPGDA
ncbi:MAG TPA: alpha/beta hydrolase-fold protein [Gaiellaceae bacterium]|nr:alpha/beta hydrolase-fold protein [Gaiellaceae bacterium]